MKQGQTFFENQLGLLDVFLVIEDPIVEGLGVAGQTLGPERADVPRDLRPELLWVGHRCGLVGRIDVDRRGVELEMGSELFDEKTDDPARRPENRQEIELHRNPGRVLALIENQGLSPESRCGRHPPWGPGRR